MSTLLNSQTILVTRIGDVHISPMLVLYTALYTPYFTPNPDFCE